MVQDDDITIFLVGDSILADKPYTARHLYCDASVGFMSSWECVNMLQLVMATKENLDIALRNQA